MLWRFSLALGIAALSLPAIGHDFSVDPTSPEVLTFRYSSSDIVDQTGAGPIVFASNLGLGSDELDGFSYGKDILRPVGGANFFVSLQFSVSRATAGAGGVVTTQRNSNGAAGDKFNLLILRNGRTVGPFLGSDAPNHKLTPGAGSSAGQSEIDGLSFPSGSKPSVYYTVARGGVKAPSDIYYVANWPMATPPVLFATAAQLGLQATDNIDALAIKDGGTLGTLDSADIVYVSLDTASPTRTAAGGSDNILQVWPAPIVVAIAFNRLDITAAGTEEIDAITGYDPGNDPHGGGGGVEGPKDKDSGDTLITLGTQPGSSTAMYIDLDGTVIGPGATVVDWVLQSVPRIAYFPPGSGFFGPSLHIIPLPAGVLVISKHANKNGAIESRILGLFDPATGKERLGLWEHFAGPLSASDSNPPAPLSGSYQESPFAETGYPIPGKTDLVGTFFHCGGGMVGPWQCGFSTVSAAPPGTSQHWMAWCDDSTGPFGQTTRLLSIGDSVAGLNGSISSIGGFDYTPDAMNPNTGHLYGSVFSTLGDVAMLDIPVTSTATGPSFGATQILMNTQTPVPSGASNERFNNFGFRLAAGSVAFRGSSNLGGDGIYVNDGNGVITKIADRTTPVPGGAGNFTSFTDTLSNDEGGVTFVGNFTGGKGIFTTATGRLRRLLATGDVLDGRTVSDVYMQRDVAVGNVIGFGARFSDNNSGLFLKELPKPFDTGDATQRAIHLDVELDPDPSILGPDPRALLVGDLGTTRLRGIWKSNSTLGTITIPGSELARLLALQFGPTTTGGIGEWVITVDIATGAILSSGAAGTLANGPFAFNADTDGGPWTSPLIAGGIPGTQAGFETNAGGLKLFCSNGFSQIAGNACGAGAFGFPAAANYDKKSGFAHMTGPLTLGNVVLWAFLGDQRWLEQGPVACPDIDSDGVCDSVDNCMFEPNAGQGDAGGVGASATPDLRGDACQCGDANGDGKATGLDGTLISRAALGLAPFPLGVGQLAQPALCDVNGGASGDAVFHCSGLDGTLVKRASLGLAPGILNVCQAAQP